METIETGCLLLIIEKDNLQCNVAYPSKHNDIVKFEKLFNQWHSGILLCESHFNGDERVLTPIGIFDNLKHFARRLKNELPDLNPITCRCTGSRLEFNIFSADKTKIESQIFATFIQMNQQVRSGHYNSI